MPVMQWYLAFAWGRAPYALDLPEVVIGRGEGCTLQIEEPAAAEEHAKVEVDDANDVFIESLHPSKPTLVNGKPITSRTAISDGDFVQIGSSVLTLRGKAAVEADAKKNFVIGESTADAPRQLATLMMEAPVLPPKPRELQRTVETSADELLAQVRRNAARPAATMQMEAVAYPSAAEPPPPEAPRPEQATLIAPAPQKPVRANATLMGVGPRISSATPSYDSKEADSRPTPIVGTSSVKSIVRPLDDDSSQPNALAPSDEELGAQPTMVANVPSQRDLPVQSTAPARNSQPDITPLPAPLPPSGSIPDLGPYVASATKKPAPASDIGSMSTMAIQSNDLGLHSAKTQAPMESPLHSAKTQAPMEAPRIDSQRAQRNVAPPTERVKPIDAKVPAASARPPESYTPPAKGPFGSFSRALDFFKQMFHLTKAQPMLLKPLYLDLGIATAFSVALSALLFILPARFMSLVMLLGLMGLYFIDYFCNALTASLLYDYSNAGTLDMEAAKARVKKSLPGIATFAAISGFLDFATTYARERNDVVAKIVLGIIHSIWTTATYWILPSMVLEGISFADSFKRSKAIMDRDPTGVGAGIVALSLTSYLVGFLILTFAVFMETLLAHIHPAIGVLFFFLCVNAYWAISGWIKISYSTCFYIWALRCEAAGRPDTELAPTPLRHALAAG